MAVDPVYFGVHVHTRALSVVCAATVRVLTRVCPCFTANDDSTYQLWPVPAARAGRQRSAVAPGMRPRRLSAKVGHEEQVPVAGELSAACRPDRELPAV